MVGTVALFSVDVAEGRSLLTYLGFLTSKETQNKRKHIITVNKRRHAVEWLDGLFCAFKNNLYA